MAKLIYQGHGSFKLISNHHTVIYVDPYAGEGYDEVADIILISHEHHDHNAIERVPFDENTVILRSKDWINGNTYLKKTIKDIVIEATQAYNGHHDPFCCVGFLITIDHHLIYAAGDTSTTVAMKQDLSKRHLDVALLPIDGIYNMDAEEATQCFKLLQAVYSIPIHTDPNSLYNLEIARQVRAENLVLLRPNEVLELES